MRVLSFRMLFDKVQGLGRRMFFAQELDDSGRRGFQHRGGGGGARS